MRGLSFAEIVKWLGVGYDANIPDLREYSGDDMVDWPLGIARLPVLPYKVTREGGERRVTHDQGDVAVEYRTPVGTVQTRTTCTEEMLQAGASEPWVRKRTVCEPSDFAAVGYIFSHL